MLYKSDNKSKTEFEFDVTKSTTFGDIQIKIAKTLFPELETQNGPAYHAARVTLKAYEAKLVA